ncbi:hypothetical protein G6514_004949 [Epicoccum nigrum]|nr:hypothetical protein G6514_004949 [Epicoccum nigrum]
MSESFIDVWAYGHQVPEQQSVLRNLIALAYKAAIGDDSSPKVLFIRVNGKYVRDITHITVAYKNERHVRDKTHVTFHAYTDGEPDYVSTVKPRYFQELREDRPKMASDRPLWPEEGEGLTYVGEFMVRNFEVIFPEES